MRGMQTASRASAAATVAAAIRVAAHVLQGTPAPTSAEAETKERVAAIAAIRDDAMVRKLQHVFDTELDEASVVKIDSNRQ